MKGGDVFAEKHQFHFSIQEGKTIGIFCGGDEGQRIVLVVFISGSAERIGGYVVEQVVFHPEFFPEEELVFPKEFQVDIGV